MRAKKRSLIKQIKPMLEKLRIQAHFWIKPDLYDVILSEMGEAPLR
jgi:predicted nucleic acid-binding protein